MVIALMNRFGLHLGRIVCFGLVLLPLLLHHLRGQLPIVLRFGFKDQGFVVVVDDDRIAVTHLSGRFHLVPEGGEVIRTEGVAQSVMGPVFDSSGSLQFFQVVAEVLGIDNGAGFFMAGGELGMEAIHHLITARAASFPCNSANRSQ